MHDFAVGAGVLGAFLVAGMLLARRERVWWWGLLLLMGAVGTGMALDVLPRGAPLEGGPWAATLQLLGWLLFGAGARAARPRLPGSLGGQAVVAGLLIGDLGASALLLGLVSDRSRAAQAALVAGAAAMLSPVGTAVVVAIPQSFGLLPIALALVVWPRGDGPEGGDIRITLGLAAITAAAWFSPWVVVVAGVGLYAWKRPALPWKAMIWVLTMGVLAWTARSSGALQQVGLGADYVLASFGTEIGGTLLVTLAAAASLVTGEQAMAVVLSCLVDSVSVWKHEGLTDVMAAAVATGGIVGPRAALRWWWRQLLVLLVWALFYLS